MKKLLLLCGLLFTLFLWFSFSVKAEEYTSYQEIVFDHENIIMLKNFSDEMYEDYYNQITEKKFIGWSLYVVNYNEGVEFISETKLKIINDGYSTIKHTMSFSTKEESKYQISASGSVGIDVSGTVKKFKGGIDADIKSTITKTESITTTETYDFNIVVDPGTYLLIVCRGRGELSTGVAKFYFFWNEIEKGGFETFCVQTEYYEIIKDKIS